MELLSDLLLVKAREVNLLDVSHVEDILEEGGRRVTPFLTTTKRSSSLREVAMKVNQKRNIIISRERHFSPHL
jgi:hypothetical protein